MCWRHRVTYPAYRDRQLFSDLLRRIKPIPPRGVYWLQQVMTWRRPMALPLIRGLFIYFIILFYFLILSVLIFVFLFHKFFPFYLFFSHCVICHTFLYLLFPLFLIIFFYILHLLSLYSHVFVVLSIFQSLFLFTVLIFFNYLPYMFLFLLSVTFLCFMLFSFHPFIYVFLYVRIRCKRRYCIHEESQSRGIDGFKSLRPPPPPPLLDYEIVVFGYFVHIVVQFGFERFDELSLYSVFTSLSIILSLVGGCDY
jgi:hypothetical protein